MSQPSLEYYLTLFGSNQQRLNAVKELLIKDFKSMEALFFEAYARKDLKVMRAQLHKMTPIVENLKFSRMLQIIEKYKIQVQDVDQFDELNQELKTCLDEIYDLVGLK